MTLFNHGGKKARDVGFIYRCHLSFIMPVSIFYDSLDWKIRLGFFSGGNHCLPQHRRDGFILITIPQMGVGTPQAFTD